jgi:Protein of unknown function (DUF2793)
MATQRNLPLITGSQNGYTTHNTALQQIDALAFGSVVGNTEVDPTNYTPVAHGLYILPGAGVGAWSGYNLGDIAYRTDTNSWVRYVPNIGLTLYSSVASSQIAWDGSSWNTIGGGGGSSTIVSELAYTPLGGNNITLPNVETILDGTHFIIDAQNIPTGSYYAGITIPGNYNAITAPATIHITVIRAPSTVNSMGFNLSPSATTENGYYPILRQHETFTRTLTFNPIGTFIVTASGFSSGEASYHVNYALSGVDNDIVTFDFPYTSQQVFVDASTATGTGNYTIEVDGDLLNNIYNRIHCEVFIIDLPVAYTNIVVDVTGTTPGQGILTRAATHNYQKITIDFDTTLGVTIAS